MKTTNLRIIILAVVAATVLAVPTAAQAASPTVNGYAANGGQVQADVSSGDGNAGAPLRELPFTGFDLWFAAAGGLLLGLAGVALRLTLRTQPTSRKTARNR